MKKRILFLCTHNSCRSQMAEALTNRFLGNSCQAYSVGCGMKSGTGSLNTSEGHHE